MCLGVANFLALTTVARSPTHRAALLPAPRTRTQLCWRPWRALLGRMQPAASCRPCRSVTCACLSQSWATLMSASRVPLLRVSCPAGVGGWGCEEKSAVIVHTLARLPNLCRFVLRAVICICWSPAPTNTPCCLHTYTPARCAACSLLPPACSHHPQDVNV